MRRRLTALAWVVGIVGAFALAWSFSPAVRRERVVVPEPYGLEAPYDGCNEGAWLPGPECCDLIYDDRGRWRLVEK